MTPEKMPENIPGTASERSIMRHIEERPAKEGEQQSQFRQEQYAREQNFWEEKGKKELALGQLRRAYQALTEARQFLIRSGRKEAVDAVNDVIGRVSALDGDFLESILDEAKKQGKTTEQTKRALDQGLKEAFGI